MRAKVTRLVRGHAATTARLSCASAGNSLVTNGPVSQFTDRLLNARYNGATFTITDQPVDLSENCPGRLARKGHPK